MDHSVDAFEEIITSEDESIEEEKKEYYKIVKEEIFGRKTFSENPKISKNPSDLPITADDVDNDSCQKSSNNDDPTCLKNPANLNNMNVCDALTENNEDDEDISPKNYFF